MECTIESSRPSLILRDLAKQTDLQSEVDCQQLTLDLDEGIGQGKIRSFDFQNGLGALILDCTLREDLTITFQGERPALVFMFNVSGEFWHQLDDNHIRYQLNPLQGTITANSSDSKQLFEFAATISLKAAAIVIDRTEYLERVDCHVQEMAEPLTKVFKDVTGKESFFYQSNYSVAISDCINKILDNGYHGLAGSTYVEGKCLELLSRQLNQFQEDMKAPSKKVMLRQYDIESIQKAAKIMVAEMQDAPTIEQLATQVGLNRQKLKKGFKQVYESTINEYLRNERLERAAALILGEHNVEAAMQAVGYQNKSFFARKFQEKYGVLPGSYKKSIKESGRYLIPPSEQEE